MVTDIELARAVKLKPIVEVAQNFGLNEEAIITYGLHKAKITSDFLNKLKQKKETGKLILVTAMSPTPAGEGKTTISIGLNDAINDIGENSIICLREPSLGPCLGMKGGAAGGGYSQVLPMEDINLHFTGDLHAITSAHNLLTSLLDNHIYWGNELDFDLEKIIWKRTIDMNDRSLRHLSLNISKDVQIQSGFDITAASEVMAILCLSSDMEELENKLGNILLGYTRNEKPIYAKDLGAHKAMAVLLKDALLPNIVQTMSHNLAVIHGGPFANIAHGCNSIIATKMALKLSDYVVTEAGFGADLGAEKFFDIKCIAADIKPSISVLVVTIRSIKMHGDVSRDHLAEENLTAIEKGLVNVLKHLENLKKFNIPVLLSINKFSTDTSKEIEFLKKLLDEKEIESYVCESWEHGAKGTHDLAKAVVSTIERNEDNFKPLYEQNLTLLEKIKKIAFELYGAKSIDVSQNIIDKLLSWENEGYKNFPICMAKTQYSFSSNPELLGAPKDFILSIRDVKLSSGAGFVVVLCGNIMTMPGLPKNPAAYRIYFNKKGQIEGLS